ncbi:hypothetical protein T4D_11605 [Trichinella pseudospiralis]|uniref:Uncharacterized protein n=1 Tax=Trichinella pseudospiralis TaxID=6337 RepID=A0A0V1FVB3_TRIPS|nr:hypothetical protein T4D_3055 [Trichinella pseudospiralis]KRY89913.1 hypothetical protein T4D_11605 [Trichinella pseudospiralis]
MTFANRLMLTLATILMLNKAVIKSRHDNTLPENACKVLFMSFAFVYVALVSMVLNWLCALQVH